MNQETFNPDFKTVAIHCKKDSPKTAEFLRNGDLARCFGQLGCVAVVTDSARLHRGDVGLLASRLDDRSPTIERGTIDPHDILAMQSHLTVPVETAAAQDIPKLNSNEFKTLVKARNEALPPLETTSLPAGLAFTDRERHLAGLVCVGALPAAMRLFVFKNDGICTVIPTLRVRTKTEPKPEYEHIDVVLPKDLHEKIIEVGVGTINEVAEDADTDHALLAIDLGFKGDEPFVGGMHATPHLPTSEQAPVAGQAVTKLLAATLDRMAEDELERRAA